MPNIIFSKRVKELRESKDLTQKSLGKEVGLSMQTINDIENGRSNTTLDKAIVIADYFNVTLDYLVGRSETQMAEAYIDPLAKEKELLLYYRLLDDVAKGKLIERSRILVEESADQRKELNKVNA